MNQTDRWIDENDNEVSIIKHFVTIENGRCVMCATLSNGESLPLCEMKTKYRKIGCYYLKIN